MKYIFAVLIFGILIIIHESGHFAAAKLCGIKVNQFSIGMGPKLLGKKLGETEYTLRLFPVGGFCAMEGADDDSDNSRSFSQKSVPKRMIVIVAGAVMNILLGFIVAIVMTCMSGDIPTSTIGGFHTKSENSSVITAQSYDCGLRKGDRIVNVEGMSILTIKDLQYALLSVAGESYNITVVRDGEKVELNNVTFGDKTTGGFIDFYISTEKKSALNVLSYSLRDTVSTARLVWISLKDLILGKFSIRDMSGPVGLVNAIGEAADSGSNFVESLISILNLSALITVNLGVVNLLPIPGLDGGRLLFLIIEAIRRKPIKPEHEGAVHLIGMALIMLLIVVITFSDIMKLIG